ncbi:endonuclease domain-containing protein [Streptomyces sp. AC495_CC817]|uniref:endonuclease domain-containing protein n=1 Tax=Streptomyces sp. AC495_CC817 TaxID=2823900 RepID=UPI001C26A2C7|nr:hypothetical protein [Streptomyces sp. AC495_CC817]
MRDDAAVDVLLAAQIGGRVTCLSLLRMLGVFVLRVDRVHVGVPRNGSRLTRRSAGTHRTHWGSGSDEDPRHATSIEEAIILAIRCQSARASVATLDSLLHRRLVTQDRLREIFRGLPSRFGVLLSLVDGSAESGPETFVRLMLRTLGVAFEVQVRIGGVGRVDFVVDGWLIIECDSREFHEGWESQRRDRARDLAAARLGYVTVRPLAADILHDYLGVQEALRDVIVAFRGSADSGLRSQLRRRAG